MWLTLDSTGIDVPPWCRLHFVGASPNGSLPSVHQCDTIKRFAEASVDSTSTTSTLAREHQAG